MKAFDKAWSVLKAGREQYPAYYRCGRCGDYFTAPEGLPDMAIEDECPHCNPGMREIFG
jgi:DNA-directed RNA polymerase subunit RPC12/RpoP